MSLWLKETFLSELSVLWHLTPNSESSLTNAPWHHYASFTVLLWQQELWSALQLVQSTPCRVCQGHSSTFNHQWFEMWERVSGSGRGHVFNNIMAPLQVTKLSSRTPSVEVTFNENASHNSLLVYLFVVVFIKIKFGISRGHLVLPICCNLTMCWEAGSDWVSHSAGLGVTRGCARL